MSPTGAELHESASRYTSIEYMDEASFWASRIPMGMIDPSHYAASVTCLYERRDSRIQSKSSESPEKYQSCRNKRTSHCRWTNYLKSYIRFTTHLGNQCWPIRERIQHHPYDQWKWGPYEGAICLDITPRVVYQQSGHRNGLCNRGDTAWGFLYSRNYFLSLSNQRG